MADPASFNSQVSNVVVTVMGFALCWLILLANIILIWGLWGTPSEILSEILERVVRKAVLEGFELLIETTTITDSSLLDLPW